MKPQLAKPSPRISAWRFDRRSELATSVQVRFVGQADWVTYGGDQDPDDVAEQLRLAGAVQVQTLFEEPEHACS